MDLVKNYMPFCLDTFDLNVLHSVEFFFFFFLLGNESKSSVQCNFRQVIGVG